MELVCLMVVRLVGWLELVNRFATCLVSYWGPYRKLLSEFHCGCCEGNVTLISVKAQVAIFVLCRNEKPHIISHETNR